MNEQETGTQQKDAVKSNRKKMLPITAASLAAVLALSCTGLGLYRHHQVQALTTECKNAVKTVKKSQQKLADLVASDDVVQALKISDKQVTDSTTIASLKQAVELAYQKAAIPECVVDYFDFGAHPSHAVAALGKTIAAQSTAVTDAVSAVNKSVAQKALADAQTKLKTTVDNANKLLADSDGKVQDNATRDELKKAIDSANKLLKDNKETDLAKYTTTTLDEAVAEVNASIEAKRKADEEAAAQAAAAAAVAQVQRSYTPTYNNYTGGGYSGGNNGGSSSYTPPADNGWYAGGIGGGEGIKPGDGSEGLPDYGVIYH